MKITLRRRDSVISAVLFIYNAYGELTGKNEIKLGSLLKMLLRFDKSEASIRTGLSRMSKVGILESRREAGEIVYELKKDGAESVGDWNKALSRFFERFAQRNGGWDGNWHMLGIPGFNKSDYTNQPVLDELRECGLRESGYSLWAAPYPISIELTAGLELRGFHWMITSGTLKTDMDLKSWLEDICELKSLKESYAAFLRSADSAEKALKNETGAALLPFLFELGWNFYDAATSDPALPKALLPDWIGDRAAARMKDLRPRLFSEIAGYFKQISE